MPVSAGIYNALNQPVRSVADYAADFDQADIRKQGMQRNALMMQEAQAAMADRQAARQMAEQRQNALQALMQQGGKPEDIEAGMLANPLLLGEGQAMRESRLKAGKLDAENRRAQFELQQQQRRAHAQQAASYQSPDEAIAHLQQAVTSGEIPSVAAQAYEKLIRTDPQWQLKLVMGAMNPEKMVELLKPHLQTRNRGGTTDTLATNQITGVPTVTSSVPNTQSPDSVASNARMAADARAAREVQVRGQDLTDRRAKDANTNAAATSKAPPGYRFTPEGNLEAIPGGPADRKNTDAGIREQRSRDASVAQADRVIAKVDEALSNVGVLTAGPGSVLAGVPGTSARNLQSTLETIKANLGFAELQAMRDASPTGGALGAIAVQELNALQSTVSSLDQGQSPTQLEKSLTNINKHYTNWKKAVTGGKADPAAPAKTVKRTGTSKGRKVVEYTDGSIEYAD